MNRLVLAIIATFVFASFALAQEDFEAYWNAIPYSGKLVLTTAYIQGQADGSPWFEFVYKRVSDKEWATDQRLKAYRLKPLREDNIEQVRKNLIVLLDKAYNLPGYSRVNIYV